MRSDAEPLGPPGLGRAPMQRSLPRVLIAHNVYQRRGGEDSVVAAEIALLRGHGHEVQLYQRHNDEIAAEGRLRSAGSVFWSRRTVHELQTIAREFEPAVIHVHNTFPMMSPSVYWLAARIGVPIVQTVHNFRLLCPQAMLLRDGHVCEDCVGRVPWRAVLYRCYRDSLPASAAVAGMLAVHRALGTYQHKVTRYIALSEFCRAKLIEGGLPARRIAVKPNFVDLPRHADGERKGALFVGRLSLEKGVDVLAQALREVPGVCLRVLGSGDAGAALRALPNAELCGWQPQHAVHAEMRSASYLILPSICYESFPVTLVEAFACGLPVIASRLGVMQELVEEGRTGVLFEPGSASDLAEKISWAEQHPQILRRMGHAAREAYEARYAPETNYRQLMGVYETAIAESRECAAGR